MPDETTKQVAQNAPPLWALAGGAAGVGGIAQAAVTLALGVVYNPARFIGFVLLSMVISGGTTILLAEVAHISYLVAAVIGALTGTVPSLIVVRAGLQKLLQQYGVELEPGALAQLGGETAPPEQRPPGAVPILAEAPPEQPKTGGDGNV